MKINRYVNTGEYTVSIKEMINWYRVGKKFFNLVTLPYTNIKIIYDLLDLVTNEGGRVLYVWGRKTVNISIVNLIREVDSKLTIGYFQEGQMNKDLTFVHYSEIDRIHYEYDLIIFDDISSLSPLNNKEIIDIAKKMAYKSHKILIVAIEKIIKTGEVLEIIDLNNKKPFIEPRCLISRVNFRKDIPYSLYEYMLWFKKLDRTVFILIPNNEDIEFIKESYQSQLSDNGIKLKILDEKNKLKTYVNDMHSFKGYNFIITKLYGDYLNNIRNLDLIVLDTNLNSFDYKKLIYFCGNVYRSNNQLGEFIIIGKECSSEVEKARDISRKFNKLIWEKGIFTL